ncbi:uncharacterized protein V6R79_012584 [Siganus canaliculatus]
MADMFKYPVFFECPSLQPEHKKKIECYFQIKRRSGGGECGPLSRDDNIYSVAFKDQSDQQRVLQKSEHVVDDLVFTVRDSLEPGSSSPVRVDSASVQRGEANCVNVSGSRSDQIIETGNAVLQQEHKKKIERYFQMKQRSGGGGCGPLKRINDNIYSVAFKDQSDQQRVLQKSEHVVDGLVFTVRDSLEPGSSSPARVDSASVQDFSDALQQEEAVHQPDQGSRTWKKSEEDLGKVSIFFECSSLQQEHKKKIEDYFQIKQRSGGGECGPLKRIDNNIYSVAFKDQRDQQRVLQKSEHVVDGLVFTVRDSLEPGSSSPVRVDSASVQVKKHISSFIKGGHLESRRLFPNETVIRRRRVWTSEERRQHLQRCFQRSDRITILYRKHSESQSQSVTETPGGKIISREFCRNLKLMVDDLVFTVRDSLEPGSSSPVRMDSASVQDVSETNQPHQAGGGAGGVIGYKAAKEAETPGEAAKKAAKEVYNKVKSTFVSSSSNNNAVFFECPSLQPEHMKKVEQYFQIEQLSDRGKCGPLSRIDSNTCSVAFRDQKYQQAVLKNFLHDVDGLVLTVRDSPRSYTCSSRGLDFTAPVEAVPVLRPPPPDEKYQQTLDPYIFRYIKDCPKAKQELEELLDYFNCNPKVQLKKGKVSIKRSTQHGSKDKARNWKEELDRFFGGFQCCYETDRQRMEALFESCQTPDEVHVYREEDWAVVVGKRSQTCGGLTEKQINTQAKAEVHSKFLVRLAGLATGTVVGAFFGSAAAVGVVMTAVRYTAMIRRETGVVVGGRAARLLAGGVVAGGAVMGGVMGGVAGYHAAEKAETVMEAVEKAADEVNRGGQAVFNSNKSLLP